MDNNEERIIEMLGQIGGKGIYEVFTAKVKSVDEGKAMMEVEDDEVSYSNVRLQAVSDGSKGVIVIPSVGSFVTIGKLKLMNQLVMLNWTKVDKILIDCEHVVYNGGDNAGLVKVKELTKKVSELEKLLNSTIQKFNTHTHTSACTAGGATTAPTTATQTKLIAPITVQADLENTKIKH